MKLWQVFFFVGLLVTFFALSFLSAKRESLTYDEIVDKEEGWSALVPHTFSVDPYNPPLIKELTVAPFLLGLQNFIQSPLPLDQALPGRIAAIFLGLALLSSVFFVTKNRFGVQPATFALFLLVFEPNILGNSHYLTLDVGFTLFFFLSYVSFLKALECSSLKNAVTSGIFLGLALGSKISGLTYLLLSGVFLCWTKRSVSKYLPFVFAISLFVLWAVYFFQSDVIVVKHDDPNRVSSMLIAYANIHGIRPLSGVIENLQNQKVPLGTYISVVKNNVIRSRQTGNTVPWYSMIQNVFLKTPMPLILFFVLGLRKKTLIFILPVIAVLVVSSVSRMSPWVRYVLPMYPFVLLIASNSLKEFKGIYRNVIFIILVVWYAIGTTNQFPHFISYANELAGSREKRFEKFVDSNIDWGQSLPDLAAYVKRKKPIRLLFSYFGRDDGASYGFMSLQPWGGYKFEDICSFHDIHYPQYSGKALIAISISNWYYCGYSTQSAYKKVNSIDVVGDSILIFNNQ